MRKGLSHRFPKHELERLQLLSPWGVIAEVLERHQVPLEADVEIKLEKADPAGPRHFDEVVVRATWTE